MLAGLVLAVIGLAWAYKAVACWLGWWPPITDLVRPHRDNSAVLAIGLVAIQLAALWAMVHLFGEEDW